MAAKARPSFRWAGSALGLTLMLSGCGAKVTAPPEPPAAVRRGDDAFRYQDYDSAIASYRRYLDRGDQGQYTPRTFYKTALAEYRLGRHADALSTLDELARRYPKAHWVQVEALRGDIQRDMGHPAMALQAWDAGWTVANTAERAALRQRIVTTARLLNDVELAYAERAVTTKDVRKLIEEQIASRQTSQTFDEPMPAEGEDFAFAEENPSESAEPGNAILASKPDQSAPVVGEKAQQPLVATARAAAPGTAGESLAAARIEQQPVLANAKVACLLPLSGAAHEFGERSLRGLRLAFGNDSDQLTVRDTGDDAVAAARIFDELANDPNVIAVIGPLQGDAARAVSPKAEAAHVPVLLLSHSEGLGGRFALPAGVNRSREMGALLDYAMQKVRLRRFGVLYPKDQYGKQALDTFRTEVTRRGGTVVGSDAYPKAVADVTSNVQTVKQWRDAQNLQAVFFADSRAPAEAFAKSVQDAMPDVTLLGMDGWEELAGHDGAFQGLLFTDTFYGGSTRPGTRAFVDAFQHAYGQLPSEMEAQAYDAALLVRRALAAGAHSRADLLQRLHGLGPVEGATGELQMTDHGVQRHLFLLQFSGGQLQEIDATTRQEFAD